MFNIFKKPHATTQKQTETAKPVKLSLKDRLKKTQQQFTGKLGQLLLGKTALTDEVLEELEDIFLQADLGVATTDEVLATLSKQASLNKINNKDDLYALLKLILQDLLIQAPALDMSAKAPFVILVIGVNGAGKTTTIGKLAKQFQQQGKSVMLAAGDTFRAAAVEQLKVWGRRNDIAVVAQQIGADAAAVAYDALSSAMSKNIDVLIVDTAGRLHTQQNLMAELEKIKRTLGKCRTDAPNEIMLVLDGNIGSNALTQAREFHRVVGLDSVSISKLDGSAKGGMLFAICSELGLPIRYVGVGEGVDDLIDFDKKAFVDALL